MEDRKIKIGKTVYILAVLLLVIIVFQLSRMGIIKNTRDYTNAEYAWKSTTDSENVSADPHGLGRVAVIKDENDPYKTYLTQNIISYLDKVNLDFTVYDVSDAADLSQYGMVVAAVSDYTHMDCINSIMSFVQQGGYAYFIRLPVDTDVYVSQSRLLGIVEKDYGEFTVSSLTDVAGLLGEKGASYPMADPIGSGARVRLQNACEVYIEGDGKPYLWRMKYGEGSVYVCAMDFLSSYRSRGIIAGILFECLALPKGKAMVFPFYNISTTILEDFPSSLKIADSLILNGMNASQTYFADHVFYPLFIGINRKYGEKLTVSYLADYGDELSGHFTTNLQNSTLMMYANDTLGKGGEIATSGYSIHPLGLEGELEEIGYFIPWESEQLMKSSFEYTFSLLNRYFKGYVISTYVLPQGRIGSGTLARLKELVPHLATVVNRYGVSYPDQYLTDFQTLSDGRYVYTAAAENGLALWGAKNSVTSLGIASNLFNLNDLLISKEITYAEFEDDLKNAYEYIAGYGLERKTVSEAAFALSQYQSASYSYRSDENSLTLDIAGFYEGMAFLIKADGQIESGNCRIVYRDGNTVIYPESNHCTLFFAAEGEP